MAVIDLDAVLRVKKDPHLCEWRIGEAAYLAAIFFSIDIYRILRRRLKHAGLWLFGGGVKR